MGRHWPLAQPLPAVAPLQARRVRTNEDGGLVSGPREPAQVPAPRGWGAPVVKLPWMGLHAGAGKVSIDGWLGQDADRPRRRTGTAAVGAILFTCRATPPSGRQDRDWEPGRYGVVVSTPIRQRRVGNPATVSKIRRNRVHERCPLQARPLPVRATSWSDATVPVATRAAIPPDATACPSSPFEDVMAKCKLS
jgi:hypothetical protein